MSAAPSILAATDADTKPSKRAHLPRPESLESLLLSIGVYTNAVHAVGGSKTSNYREAYQKSIASARGVFAVGIAATRGNVDNLPTIANTVVSSASASAPYSITLPKTLKSDNEGFQFELSVFSGSSKGINPPLNWKSAYPWIEDAQLLEKNGRDDLALRVVYRRLTGMLKTEDFPAVDALLRSANADDLSVDFLLAFLTATLRLHAHLNHRPSFFRRVAESIRKRGLKERPLLNGLG